MRGMIVSNGVVENVAAYEDGATLPDGWQIAPEGVGPGHIDNNDGTFSPPPEPPLPAKLRRDLALAGLVHDFGDGRVIQTRPRDEQNIRNAIELMEANAIPERDWVMADNVKHPVTVAELREALAAGQLAAMAVWDDYTPDGA